jgi:hypothetical protein
MARSTDDRYFTFESHVASLLVASTLNPTARFACDPQACSSEHKCRITRQQELVKPQMQCHDHLPSHEIVKEEHVSVFTPSRMIRTTRRDPESRGQVHLMAVRSS